MRTPILSFVIALVTLSGLAFYANDAMPPPQRKALRTSYTSAEILEYLLFSSGRAATEHPLAGKLNAAAPKLPPEMQLRTVSETVSRCINSIDEAAGPALSAAFNTADAQLLDGALQRFDAAASRWPTLAHAPGAPCPPPPPPPSSPPSPKRFTGIGKWNFIVALDDFYLLMLTIGGAVATSVVAIVMGALLLVYGAVVGFWVVPALLSYEFENHPTDLDRQTAIAKIVKALRT